MRRRIEAFPSYLPHARLYLDDIEAITNVVVEEILQKLDNEVKTDPHKVASRASDIKIQYLLGKEQMDTISDLAEQGGSTTRLTVTVEGPRYVGCSLEIRGSDEPWLRLH